MLYHLLVLLHAAAAPRRRRAGARWPSPLGAGARLRSAEDRRAGARARVQPDPVCARASSPTARRPSRRSSSCARWPRAAGVPARVRRAGPALGRYSFIGFRPRSVLRWSLRRRRRPLRARRRSTSLASARRRPRSSDAAPVRRRRRRLLRLRPRAHRRAARASPNPDPLGPARHGADAHRRAASSSTTSSTRVTILACADADARGRHRAPPTRAPPSDRRGPRARSPARCRRCRRAAAAPNAPRVRART